MCLLDDEDCLLIDYSKQNCANF